MNPYDKNPGNLKPPTGKAPLHLLPARPLGAIAAGVEDGAKKYAPYNYREQTENVRDVYTDALLRHATAFADPGESDYAADSGVHHLAHAAANILILLDRLGIEYPARAPEAESPEDATREELRTLCKPGDLPTSPPIAVEFGPCDDHGCGICYNRNTVEAAFVVDGPCDDPECPGAEVLGCGEDNPSDRPIPPVDQCLECGAHSGAHFDSCSANKA